MTSTQPPGPAAPPEFDPAAVVLASAGAGKTFQLAMRIIRLLHDRAEPSSILASTFTRKAAGEILARVLRVLAAAALDAKELSALRKHVDPGFTHARAAEMLALLAKELHRFGVMTLDSFMVRACQIAALDLNVLPGWKLGDEAELASMHDAAVDAAWAEVPRAELLDMLRRRSGGSLNALVRDALSRAAEAAHKVYLETIDQPQAWEVVCPTDAQQDDAEVARLLRAAESVPVPLTRQNQPNKLFAAALPRVLGFVRFRNWKPFLQDTLVSACLESDAKFARADVPDPLRAAIAALARHAVQCLLADLRERNIATRELARLYDDAYEHQKLERGIRAFDDIPVMLLSGGLTPEQLAFQLDPRPRHILLDEFQDTSLAQFAVLSPMLEEATSGAEGVSAFCVGDAKQSLYSWRNAEPALLPMLARRFNMNAHVLSRNFRSSPAVLQAVDRVFGGLGSSADLASYPEAVTRFSDIYTAHVPAREDLEGVVRVERIPKADDPFEAAAARVLELVSSRPGARIAVLCRTRKELPRLLHLLQRMGIAASQEGGGSLRDTRAVLAARSLLHFADHPSDSAAYFHAASSPFGAALGLDRNLDHEAASRAMRARFAREGLESVLRELRVRCADRMSPTELARFSQLIRLAGACDDRGGGPADLLSMIDRLAVESPADTDVRLMTIHGAKGLEFDSVILPDLHKAIYQHPRSEVLSVRPGPAQPVCVATLPASYLRRYSAPLAQAHDQHASRVVYESLCILYVAMTRAIHSLDIILPDILAGSALGGLILDAHGSPRKVAPGPPQVLCGSESWSLARRSEPAPASRPMPAYRPAPAADAPAAAAARLARIAPSSAGHVRLGRDLFDGAPRSASGLARGELVHLLLAGISWLDPEADLALPPAPSLQLALASGFDREAVTAAWAAIREAYCGEFGSLFHPSRYPEDPAPECLIERPIAARVLDRGREVLLSGQVDRLVLVRSGGIITRAEVIDFKTDRMDSPEDRRALVDRYAPQLRLYAAAVAKVFRVRARAISVTLAHLGTGLLLQVPPQGDATSP